MAGVPVQLYENDVSLGSAYSSITNSEGQVSFTVTGGGKGDVVYKVVSSSISGFNGSTSSNITIEDCYLIDSMTNSNNKWVVDSSVTATYDTTGVNLTSTACWKHFTSVDLFALPLSFEFEVVGGSGWTYPSNNISYNNVRPLYFAWDKNTSQLITNGLGATGETKTSSTVASGDKIKIIFTKTSYSIYKQYISYK